jgi:phosphopantothenoylcysteine decarboxylase
MEERGARILVGVTGSVASVKLGELVSALLKLGDVKVVSTACAEHFWRSCNLADSVPVYRDRDEWSMWQKMGDEVSVSIFGCCVSSPFL